MSDVTTSLDTDTIAAIATPSGSGGVGIIRLSGVNALSIGQTVSNSSILTPRYATYTQFYAGDGAAIDSGLILYFPNPHSFTGEDVVELHGHGGQLILNMILRRCLELGAREARAGEFSERAFLNEKLDLIQAEAIADLINAQTESAARQAQASLQGKFSEHIDGIARQMVALRMYVEAAIDFPEEEIDFLSDGKVAHQLATLIQDAHALRSTAAQGAIYRTGATVVLAGKPNAGKSSLMNYLAGDAIAIVTDQPGTTRDVVKEHINIDGVPIYLTDTAGLRETDDAIEKEGVRRAKQAITQADITLHLVDDTDIVNADSLDFTLELKGHCIKVLTKIDLSGRTPGVINKGEHSDHIDSLVVGISAQTGEGVDTLKAVLIDALGLKSPGETLFSARERHIKALNQAIDTLETAQDQFLSSGAGELLAEDLRLAHNYLGAITGKMSNDDLLGEIFSSFCIGK